MSVLVSTKRVLEKWSVEKPFGPEIFGAVTFVHNDEDSKAFKTIVSYDYPTWITMGSPEIITVLVEYGDTLNEDKE